MSRKSLVDKSLSATLVHGILICYSILALWPIFLVVSNSFKSRKGIFNDPMAVPTAETFSTIGFDKVLGRSNFDVYFLNSITVTVMTLGITLLIGAMAAWALAGYKYRLNTLLAFYLAIGIMVPIRLGTVSILKLVVAMGLMNSLTALILVYIAMSLPLTIFILNEFMNKFPTI